MEGVKYRSLVETLKRNILDGRYGKGNSFPSVRALIRRYGLSNTTVLHAMDELVRQGLVLRRQGCGTFVCGNDAAAVSLKQSLERLGKNVPCDVLLVGFDDVQFAKIVSPQLTTVRQPCEKIAETAFYRLLDRIANPTLTPIQIALPVCLVVRDSTEKVCRDKTKKGNQ